MVTDTKDAAAAAPPERIIAVTWRFSFDTDVAHAVGLRTGTGRETETDRIVPVALCGNRPRKGFSPYSLFVGEEAERCEACEGLYAADAIGNAAKTLA